MNGNPVSDDVRYLSCGEIIGDITFIVTIMVSFLYFSCFDVVVAAKKGVPGSTMKPITDLLLACL